MFFSIRADGLLDIWDFFLKQNDPVLSLPVSGTSLTSFRIQENGRMAAVGARDGSTAILQLADSLVEMQPNEKQSLTSVSPNIGLSDCTLTAILSSGEPQSAAGKLFEMQPC